MLNLDEQIHILSAVEWMYKVISTVLTVILNEKK